MPNDKLTLAKTDAGILISNLRGEVGEVITTWLLMRRFMADASRIRTGDEEKDWANREFQFANLLADKLADELVGRLSELAERKIGQLTFHFAACKLQMFADDTKKFADYIIRSQIRDKRNRDVSHKQLPGLIPNQKYLHIPYPILLRAVALALRLMKRIDRHQLGPAAPYMWREARRRRYSFMSPPRVGYMLVPYLNLSPDDRVRIVQQELAEGKSVFSKMTTKVNGLPVVVLACKQWGVIVLDGVAMALGTYPLISLDSISVGS